MWLAFKQSNGFYGICREVNLPHVIVVGVGYTFLQLNDDPLKLCNWFLKQGITHFDQSYVKSFLAGHNRPWQKSKRVVCVETKVVYDSMNQACDCMGLHHANLSNHLRGKKGYKTVKGFTFKFYSEEQI